MLGASTEEQALALGVVADQQCQVAPDGDELDGAGAGYITRNAEGSLERLAGCDALATCDLRGAKVVEQQRVCERTAAFRHPLHELDLEESVRGILDEVPLTRD